MMKKASIAGLTIDPASNMPIIILKTDEDSRTVPIWIGLLEATSIASALQNIKFDRPMTHDLFKNFADRLRISVTRVEVVDIRDNTFFARVHCASAGADFSMDARPSDAIALALRFSAPIFVAEEVIEKSERGPAPPEVLDESEEGKKWADYLENLSDEDFGKYKV